MELKHTGRTLIFAAGLLLALGILTGGIVFYALVAVAVAAVSIDYLRCRATLRDLERHLTVSRRVSTEDLALGSHLDLTYELNYTGSRSFFLRCIQPAGPKEFAPGQTKDVFLTKGVQAVRFAIKPAKYGKYLVPGLRMVSQTYLFQGTVTGGGAYPVNVYITIGGLGALSRLRSSLRARAMGGLGVALRQGGCDFAGIRDYVPGDSIRYIDWARSTKSSMPVVRDFEEAHVMPSFLLIDADASMQAGGSRSQLDSAVKFAMSISQEILSNYESVGLACFSLKELTYFLPPGSGKAHRAQLMSRLLSLETRGEAPARPLDMPALHEAVLASKALASSPDLQPLLTVMDGAIDSLAASVLEDGFIQAISRVSQAGTQCHLVILTNLSMGIASLLNGIRMAHYSGHKATVLLMPHIWYEPPDQADPGVLYAKYRRFKEIVSLLRSMNVNVIEVCPADKPETMAAGYRMRNPIPRM